MQHRPMRMSIARSGPTGEMYIRPGEAAKLPILMAIDDAAGEQRSLMKSMRFGQLKFGFIQIDGEWFEHDVVIDKGRIRKRKKKPSKPFRGSFGHTPLSAAEDIPWECRRLVIGTGASGALPVMEQVKREAQARHVELVMLPTPQAIEALVARSKDTNAILHVTC